MRTITMQQAIDRAWENIEHQEYQRATFARNSFAWKGHNERIKRLVKTITAIAEGQPCNRAVAQLFSAGYRIGDGQ